MPNIDEESLPIENNDSIKHIDLKVLNTIVSAEEAWTKLTSSTFRSGLNLDLSTSGTSMNLSNSLMTRKKYKSPYYKLLDIPPRFIPFLPKSSTIYDLVLVIEHCACCHLHSMSLRHDEHKYTKLADSLLDQIVNLLIDHTYPVRLFAYKKKSLKSEGRLGALEVSMALKACDDEQLNNLLQEIEMEERNESKFLSDCTVTLSHTFLPNGETNSKLLSMSTSLPSFESSTSNSKLDNIVSLLTFLRFSYILNIFQSIKI
jgi:hypothetical protein